MHDDPVRRMRRGVFAGRDGDRPTMNLDASIHEIAAHTTTTVHRHSWDAIMFIESGSGWTEIDGQRIDWRPWDTLHLPAWAWHRHGNDGERPAIFHTWSVEPMLEQFGVAILEEGGDTPVRRPAAPARSRSPRCRAPIPTPGGRSAWPASGRAPRAPASSPASTTSGGWSRSAAPGACSSSTARSATTPPA